MHRLTMKYFWSSIAATALLAAFVTGCHDGHGACSCNDIPPGAVPQPNGQYQCQWTNAQRARAEQDRFVIYQYEWSAEPAKLTVNGQEHVASLAHALDQSPYPVIVEPSPDAGLNESRRAAVLNALANAGCPTNPARVVCGRSEAEGLYGEEAAPIARGMLSSQGGQGGGGGGTSVGSSFGGSQGGGSSSAGGASGGMGVY